MKLPKKIIMLNTNIAWKHEGKKYEIIDLSRLTNFYVYNNTLNFVQTLVTGESDVVQAYAKNRFDCFIKKHYILYIMNKIDKYREYKEFYKYKHVNKKIIETLRTQYLSMDDDDNNNNGED